MNIAIKEYNNYKQDEIIDLYKSVGWINYTQQPEKLKKGYENSLCILGAYKDDELVGIIRAVGDGVTILFIQDIIVLPEYQRNGIGTQLIKTVLEKYSHVYQIELLTDDTEKTVEFYKSVGFKPANEIGAMSFVKM